ncbi:MAG: hypothetical protein LUC50_01850 [Ruminococcus sp.]|nr:hypothetical protein [Ruminococcus sp.]
MYNFLHVSSKIVLSIQYVFFCLCIRAMGNKKISPIQPGAVQKRRRDKLSGTTLFDAMRPLCRISLHEFIQGNAYQDNGGIPAKPNQQCNAFQPAAQGGVIRSVSSSAYTGRRFFTHDDRTIGSFQRLFT